MIWRGEERVSGTTAAGRRVGGGGASLTAETAAEKQKERRKKRDGREEKTSRGFHRRSRQEWSTVIGRLALHRGEFKVSGRLNESHFTSFPKLSLK